jgi:hypothetical protein
MEEFTPEGKYKVAKKEKEHRRRPFLSFQKLSW